MSGRLPRSLPLRMASLLAVLAATAAPAAAGVVVHAVDFGGGGGFGGPVSGTESRSIGFQGQHSLPRFDPVLGTLTGVRFGFTSTARLSVNGYATDDQAEIVLDRQPSLSFTNDVGFSASWQVDLGLALIEPGGAGAGFARQLQSAGSCAASRPESITVACGFAGALNFDLAYDVDTAGLPLTAFIGADPIRFAAWGQGELTTSCDADDAGDDCRLGGFDAASVQTTGATWFGTARVEYRYDAVADPPTGTVPVPGSLWLAGLALAAIVPARRARRR